MISTVSGNPSIVQSFHQSRKPSIGFYIEDIYFIGIFHLFSFESQLKLAPCSDCIYDVLPGKYSSLYNRDRTFHKNGNVTSMVFSHLRVNLPMEGVIQSSWHPMLSFVTLHFF